MFSHLKTFLLLVIILLLSLNIFFSSPVLASIRETEEAPGQVLIQSRHTLQDFEGNSWQVVLFKRVKPDHSASVSLRLVGFPGNVEFSHPQPLIIAVGSEIKSAEDMFAQLAPAPNVGQYDFTEIITELSPNLSLRLSLPLNNQSLELKVPSVVVLEWLKVNE
ncbi:MAG: DUF3122 domain-containing protein [Gomphosphaeria aponina SAG 52.96 = DSM 107014]|uniref:DUF3122 domain-containing protein n=1 Tax=Gomphosphaeria aponina SAG 52.96 = DSM 107014 TaxID=1521640 RepID=A0A941JNW5_9CHRO|nr:DUF3122 domain-containing protein [Gomphosphaeria aponina SAG 52.96 = DSM 107014]